MDSKVRWFRDCKSIREYTMEGRWPSTLGRPYRSFARLFARDEKVEVHVHKTHVLNVYPDDAVEFVATTRDILGVAVTLSGSLPRVLPIEFINFDTKRYRVRGRNNRMSWLEASRTQQEYFQHLRLNLKTGEIINPKDMSPIVNDDKRKAWIRNLKAYRQRLRTMAKIGVFDNMAPASRHGWMGQENIKRLAEAIMAMDFSEEVLELLANATGRWKYRNQTMGDAVMDVFNSTLQNNSREMRLHLGVISIED